MLRFDENYTNAFKIPTVKDTTNPMLLVYECFKRKLALEKKGILFCLLLDTNCGGGERDSERQFKLYCEICGNIKT